MSSFVNIAFGLVCALFVGSVQGRLMFMEVNASSALQYSHHMDNQHIVLMGDSLMRYQYLSLVYLLHNNKVVDPDSVPNILIEKTYGGWPPFWAATHAAVAQYEYCDCSSVGGFEHRYYFNPVRNISVTFIAYVGDNIHIGGAWSPGLNGSNHFNHPPADDPVSWLYHTVQEAIVNVAAKLTPRPTTLVLNAGHWGNRWNETEHRDGVLSLAKSLFPRVIWKTTNYIVDHVPGDYQNDAFVCSYPGIECMNLDWTRHLHESHYWDRVHFRAEVYTDINIQFMLQLIKHKPLHIAPMGSEHHAQIINHNGRQWVVDKVGILRPFAHPTDSACVTDVASRTNVHMTAHELFTHILGEHVRDICEFLAG